MQTPVNFELLTKHLAGEATPAEAMQVQQWLEASAANQRQYRQLQKIWQASATAKVAEVETFMPDIGQAWNNVAGRIGSSALPAGRGKAKAPEAKVISLYSWVWKVAAVLVVGLGITFAVLRNTNKEMPYMAALTEEAISSEQKSELVLADGTRVWLNRNSKLRYPASFTGNTREVYLEGEAFFEVTRNPQQPFLIHAQQSVTQVLGTSFNVNAYAGRTDVTVTVVTGKVSLADEAEPEKQVLLTPGEQGIYLKEEKRVSEQPNPDLNFLAWKTGVLTFRKEPLAEVVRALETHYNTRFRFENQDLKNCRVSVTLDNQPLEEVLEILKLTLDIDYDKKDSTVILKGAGCPASS